MGPAMRRFFLSWVLMIGLLSACSAPTTPEAIPTQEAATPVQPAATRLPEPTPTRAPAPGMTGLAMFEAGGWGWDADGEKLYRSTDEGQAWKAVRLPENAQFNFSISAFLDLNTAWLAGAGPLTDGQRLLHTVDGGATWTETTPRGLESLAGDFRYHFVNASEGWAEAAGAGAGNLYVQVFETLDGGASYQVVPMVPLHAEEGLPQGTVHLCNMCADSFHYDPARIVIITGDMGSMESRGAVHGYVSFDRGESWKELSLPLPEKYQGALVWPLETSFVNDKDGFLPVVLVKYNPDGSSLYRVLIVYASHDGGVTWELAPGLLEQIPNYPMLQFLNNQDAMVQCGEAVCVTHDGAKTWQAFPLDPSMVPNDSRSITELQFVDPLAGWMVIGDYSDGTTSYRIYKTTDGAASWIPQ